MQSQKMHASHATKPLSGSDPEQKAGFFAAGDSTSRLRRILPIRPALVLLAFLLILAYGVRAAWSDYGLPYEVMWDEPELMQPVARLLRHGIYRPENFDYGPINVYVHGGWGALSYLRGIKHGAFPKSIWGVETDLDTGWYWSVPSAWLLEHARLFCALLGVLAGWFVYAAGRTLHSRRVGLWALVPATFLSATVSQTSTLSADALAMAAAAGCLYATAVYWRGGTGLSLASATAAAALAASCKYNAVTTVLLPLLAPLLRPRNQAEAAGHSPSHGPIASILVLVGYVVLLALFLFPALLNPAQFLHDVTIVLGFYDISSKEAVPGSGILSYAQQLFALFDSGDFRGPNRTIFYFKWYGLGALLLLFVGAASVLRRDWRLALLLLVPPAATLLIVGGEMQNFYTRYLIYALYPLSIVVAFGGESLTRSVESLLMRSGRLRLSAGAWLATSVVALLLFPIPLRVSYHALKAMSPEYRDSRVKLSEQMLARIPEGSRILILDETRWEVSPSEEKRFKISRTTIPRADYKVISPRDYDYILAPAAVVSASGTPLRKRIVERMNDWLSNFKGTPVLEAGGNAPVYFGRPTSQPGVRLWRADQFARKTMRIPEGEIFGVALDPGTYTKGARLGEGVLAVRSGANVTAPVRLTQSTTKAVLRAMGRNPHEGGDTPVVDLEVYNTTATQTAKPVVTKTFKIDKYRSGFHDYTHSGSLPAGDYIVKLRPSEPSGYLTFIELLRFE